jgi:hypothetical protein
MKTKFFIAVLLLVVVTTCCLNKGEASQNLNGDENELPDELKGLKVYTVGIGNLNNVRVAVLNGEINSLTYTEGKATKTTIIINKDRYNKRTIVAKDIVMENDSLILIRKH